MPADRSDKLFVEWSHKVFEELTTLNARLESLDEKYAHLDKKLEKINELLTGNGSPEKGLVVRVDRIEQNKVEDLKIRVDRLEQSEGRRMWLIRSLIVACITTILTTIASYFKRY